MLTTAAGTSGEDESSSGQGDGGTGIEPWLLESEKPEGRELVALRAKVQELEAKLRKSRRRQSSARDAVREASDAVEMAAQSARRSAVATARALEACVFALAHDYVFISRIHSGIRAAVYLATARATEGPAPSGKTALKIVTGYGAVSVDRPPREVSMLLRLRAHPCIVSIDAWYPLLDQNAFAIAMPHIVHEDFDPASEPRKLVKYMWDTLQALAFCHAASVVVRDVKPSNILFDMARQRAVLIDFDCATHYDPSAPPRDLVGTRGFLAPEIIDDRLRLDGYGYPVDMYSAGLTFFALVFRVPPRRYSAMTHPDVFDTLEAAASTAKSRSSRAQLLELISGLVAASPAHRWTADAAIAHRYFDELRKRKTGTPAALRSPAPRSPASRLSSGRKGTRIRKRRRRRRSSVSARRRSSTALGITSSSQLTAVRQLF
ncbi:CAMK/PHK protein kinase [Thecamonas trahens ATCC 50062]|uniref:CAMK/PHK protein kinase n=1 Tax=Thecamonas trahens ATCC 50062 TaxID=461836 RepID=A0A0L0DTI2_THETB|nr:CAMK/PHK protein kinase [Thecamonas trahens ATCC 50062]KNC54768.1 CAMK/PHK protein kinase [Thecamonas trahens ATCC 50062]|eukprot:XP_013761668.1 CAMK/PHK protein kinase [Thecamonas trahens ATCC 50062]